MDGHVDILAYLNIFLIFQFVERPQVVPAEVYIRYEEMFLHFGRHWKRLPGEVVPSSSPRCSKDI